MMVSTEQLKAQIDEVLSKGGKITEVPTGYFAKPETAHEPSWQDESRRHRFTVSRRRDAYKPPVSEDGEPEV